MRFNFKALYHAATIRGRLDFEGGVYRDQHARAYTTSVISLPYSRKIWRGIKFGGLAVSLRNRQIKIRQNLLLAYIPMAIPYQTAKFKSTNTFAMAIWDPTAKFNSRQYFRLYSICMHVQCACAYIYCCQPRTMRRDFEGGVYWDELADDILSAARFRGNTVFFLACIIL